MPDRWRRYLALAAALVLGAVVGGYCGFVWGKSAAGAASDTALSAEIRGLHALTLPYPPYRLALRLHNDGTEPVTVQSAHLRVPGFDVSLGLSETRVIGPGKSMTALYGVSPTCETARPDGAGSVQLRLRGAFGMDDTTTLPAAIADDSIATGYAILCSGAPPGLTIDAETRSVVGRGNGDPLLHLTFSRDGDVGRAGPSHLWLLKVGVDASGLETEGVSVEGASRLPATVPLDLRVTDCVAARGAVDDPTTLRVALTSDSGPHLLYAHADAEFTDALRRHVERRCRTAD